MTPGKRTPLQALILAVVIGSLAAGCGGGNKATPVVPTAERTGQTGELTVYTVRSAGISVGVPRSWKSISSDNVDRERLDKLAEQNPAFGDLFKQLYQPGSPIKLMALDPEVKDGFATNLSVVVRDAAPGETTEDYTSAAQLEEFKRQAAAFLAGPIESITLDLPAGKAHKLAYRARLTSPEGQVLPLYQEQYELVSDGKYYALIYTTNSDRQSELEDVFADSVASFRIR
jgi:hypothetical protein